MGRHALLSASSSHRWLACPPSARLCENYEDTGSEYAQQGTDAHSLCEHKLKLSLGMETKDPAEGLSFYDEEMEECACGYAEYVLSLVEEAKQSCKDPVVLIEQRLDFSRYVEEGFGTGDCVIIADGTLYIIDYKHGKGVEVSAEGNPQMMLYALGALELFDGIYDIDTVRMAIYQPRRENVSVYDLEIVGSSSDIGSGLTFDHRPGLLDFHNAAVDGEVGVLLIVDLARLSRDLDRTIQYWHLLRDLDVSIHTVNSGEVDLGITAILSKILEQ